MRKYDALGIAKTISTPVGRSLNSFAEGTTANDRWNLAGGYTVTVALTTGAPTSSVIRAIPFIAPARGGTIDRLGFNVTTLQAGTGIIGLYGNTSDVFIYPSSLIDQGQSSTGSTGAKTSTINARINPGGLYWLAYISSAVATLRCPAQGSHIPLLGYDNTLGTAMNIGYSKAITFPTGMPNPFPASAVLMSATPYPALFYRFSA